MQDYIRLVVNDEIGNLHEQNLNLNEIPEVVPIEVDCEATDELFNWRFNRIRNLFNTSTFEINGNDKSIMFKLNIYK